MSDITKIEWTDLLCCSPVSLRSWLGIPAEIGAGAVSDGVNGVPQGRDERWGSASLGPWAQASVDVANGLVEGLSGLPDAIDLVSAAAAFQRMNPELRLDEIVEPFPLVFLRQDGSGLGCELRSPVRGSEQVAKAPS